MNNTINPTSASRPSSANLQRAWDVRNSVWNVAQSKGLTSAEVAHVLDGIAPPSGEPSPSHMAEAAKARGQELKYLRDKFHTPPQFGAPTATGSNGSLVVNASGLKGVTSVSAKVRYPTYVLDTTPPKYPVGADGRVSIVRPNLLEGTKGDKVTVAITCVPEPINSVAKKLGVPPNEPQTFVREFRT